MISIPIETQRFDVDTLLDVFRILFLNIVYIFLVALGKSTYDRSRINLKY